MSASSSGKATAASTVPMPDEAPEIEALVAASRSGDRAAAHLLWDVASTRLTRMALALGVAVDDVPDLVQEVLLAAWKNLERFDSRKGSFIGWLVPGLRGRALNRIRDRGRRDRFLDRMKVVTLRPVGRDAQDTVDARVTLERLAGALTQRQREVMALYEIDGMSAVEAGRILEISEAGVRSIARDARRRLRDEARRLDGEDAGRLYGRR